MRKSCLQSMNSIQSNYRTISVLGSGTYGVVRLALDRNGRQVAIKTVQTGMMRADRKELLQAEADALQTLKHKHIIELKEVLDEEEFQTHFVMECARGGDLLQYVNSKGKLEEGEAREFFSQLCSAIEYTHRSGLIHRDLKLENILLDMSRSVKLADWGYATRWASGAKLTASLGSLHYAAPEICSGKEYTGRIIFVFVIIIFCEWWSIMMSTYFDPLCAQAQKSTAGHSASFCLRLSLGPFRSAPMRSGKSTI